MSDIASPAGARKDRVIAILVAQALDDLEAGHIDLTTTLRLVIERAWIEGYEVGLAYRDTPEPPIDPPRGARSDES